MHKHTKITLLSENLLTTFVFSTILVNAPIFYLSVYITISESVLNFATNCHKVFFFNISYSIYNIYKKFQKYIFRVLTNKKHCDIIKAHQEIGVSAIYSCGLKRKYCEMQRTDYRYTAKHSKRALDFQGLFC